MLAKLLALLAEFKAAGVTVVLIAGAATVTVAGATPEVQDSLQQLASNVGLTAASRDCDDGRGQPVVVAQRNAADKFLRAAYQKDLKALVDLRGGKDQDNKAVGEIVRSYSDQLRGRLDKALNDTAALTLGRTGQVRKAEASSSPSGSPSASPSGSATPSASCTPAPSGSAAPTASPSPSASPTASGSAEPKTQGRVAVAERTTLDAAIQTIVDEAIKDMDELVKKATDEVALVPAPVRGKPSDAGKSSDNGKPSGNPGNKPSDKPGKPTATP